MTRTVQLVNLESPIKIGSTVKENQDGFERMRLTRVYSY